MTVWKPNFKQKKTNYKSLVISSPSPKSRTNAWKMNYIEPEGWIFDVREISATKEEESLLSAWKRRSSKMNAPPLLEQTQQRRVMSCTVVCRKEGMHVEIRGTGERKGRRGGRRSIRRLKRENKRLHSESHMWCCMWYWIGGLPLWPPYISSGACIIWVLFLALSYHHFPLKLQLIYLPGSIFGWIYKSGAGSAP